MYFTLAVSLICIICSNSIFVAALPGSSGLQKVIFYEKFENAKKFASDWYNSGAEIQSKYKLMDKQSLKLNSSDKISKSVDTTGYTNIVIKYAVMTTITNKKKHLYCEWYDGSTWNMVSDITSKQGWVSKIIDLPQKANNNENLMIRFRTSGYTDKEYAYIDEVSVTGNETRKVAIDSITVNKPSPQKLGSSVNITASASGGESIQYQFVVNDKIAAAFSSTDTYCWKPTETGDYLLTVTVKDVKGNSISKSVDYEIDEQTELLNSDFSIENGNVPMYWTAGYWADGTIIRLEDSNGYNGANSVSITSNMTNGNDAWLSQKVKLQPKEFYTLKAFVKGENIVPVGDAKTGANLCLVGTWNNTGEGNTGSFGWKEISMDFEAPASGEVEIGLRLGFWNSTMKGKVYFSNISLEPSRTIAKKEGDHVILGIGKDDVSVIDPANLDRWLKHLDGAYVSYQELTGYVPFDGEKISIVPIDNAPYWAAAGNPITWNKSYIKSELTACNNSDNWSFGILHEIGHDFDYEGWNWDAEFWANT
ncbi:MAG: hypothetical protein Q8880_11655, partial [Bacteroidota bacterium]|nr:hypothetical protein [Bacteroidota bacterium]